MRFASITVLLFAIPSFADEPLRIICFGAHPDDCELKAGGVGAMWAAKGCKVKFVSVTNGDVGHWRESGPALARRRKAEVLAADKSLGIETEVLDIHDGELEPTLANRKTIIRLIREWKADIVMSHRPNDYHPDHRYTGVLGPGFGVHGRGAEIHAGSEGTHQEPGFPLSIPIAFRSRTHSRQMWLSAIDSVMAKKVAALERMESQFYEGGANGGPELMPSRSRRRKRNAKQQFARDFKTATDATADNFVEARRLSTDPTEPGKSNLRKHSKSASTGDSPATQNC